MNSSRGLAARQMKVSTQSDEPLPPAAAATRRMTALLAIGKWPASNGDNRYTFGRAHELERERVEGPAWWPLRLQS